MTGKRALALLAAALVVLAAAGAGGSATDPWKRLRRPLHLPSMTSGRCPVTSGKLVTSGFSFAQGTGPVYPVNGYPRLIFPLLVKPGSVFYPSQWSGQKMLWIAQPKFKGRVLVRGHEIGGINQVGFGADRVPAGELHLDIKGGRSWWSAATYTRVRTPGCYAFQIDGATFSRVVVFRAQSF